MAALCLPDPYDKLSGQAPLARVASPPRCTSHLLSPCFTPPPPAPAALDFGTSNSTVGCVRPGHASLLPLEEGKVTLPSVVFFNADDGSTCFGRTALQEYLAGYEGRLMRSMKSLLGSRLLTEEPKFLAILCCFETCSEQFIGELKRRADLHGGSIRARGARAASVFRRRRPGGRPDGRNDAG